MWRRCDFHIHTTPNEQYPDDEWDPDKFVRSCTDAGLDVVAVTDHDHVDHVEAAMRAAEATDLIVIPGVELSTDRGHLLVLSAGEHGLSAVTSFVARVGARPEKQVVMADVLATASRETQPGGAAYATNLVLIGAHVDKPGSLLGSPNPLGLEGQLELAERLHALEVSNEQVLQEWRASGVKQGPELTLLRGSDTHSFQNRREWSTWLYLPDVGPSAIRHALALRESSVSFVETPPESPRFGILSITFVGGHHDGLMFKFCERTNAIIGPPNSGKSLIVDAFKFVFDIRSELADVESISESRMAKCLPHGASVEIRYRTPAGVSVLARTQGGRPPELPPELPIIFSQTELTRRSIASAPAIGLLDIHVVGVDQLKTAIDARSSELRTLFETTLEQASKARELRASVTNPVDGLEATRTELNEIAGKEEVAKLATVAAKVVNWRDRTRKEIDRWRGESEIERPQLPSRPAGLDAVEELPKYVPTGDIAQIFSRFSTESKQRVNAVADEALAVLDSTEASLDALRADVDHQLAEAGFNKGGELESRLTKLRDRVDALEQEEEDLRNLETQIDQSVVQMQTLHRSVDEARSALSQARRSACSEVNQSMRTFFAKLSSTSTTQALDSLIDDLKTGTYLRAESRHELRDSLDRFRVVEYAIRWAQGRGGELEGGDRDQDRVVATAMERGRWRDVAKLACLWPGDALELFQKGSPPTRFAELTEGLRALAIKEVSFAASELPVISDQPEDAVPTRSVFESLVPTLREQRLARQFIVVSHDANIVVASDIDEVVVLDAGEDGSPHVGTLADPIVRSAALEHLEGGVAAFQLRARRYAQLGSQ